MFPQFSFEGLLFIGCPGSFMSVSPKNTKVFNCCCDHGSGGFKCPYMYWFPPGENPVVPDGV